MPVNEYTNRELGILLEKLTEKIDTYHKDFKEEIKELRGEVDENKTFRTKALAIVSVIAVTGSALAQKVLANLGL